MNRYRFIACIALLAAAMLFPAQAWCGELDNGYTYENVIWTENGYLDATITNISDTPKKDIQLSVTFLNEDASEVYLQKTIAIGQLDPGETYQVHSFVGPPRKTPGQFRISIRDDDQPVELRDPNAPPQGDEELVALELVDMEFSGEGPELTDSFVLSPGTYYFALRYEGQGPVKYTLSNGLGSPITVLLEGRDYQEQIVTAEIEETGQYRLRVKCGELWSARILDQATMDRIRKEQERNQFDVQTGDDGSIVITN